MLSKLKVYGELADFCGGNNQFEAVINTPIDAVRFLKVNFAGLEKHMSTDSPLSSLECLHASSHGLEQTRPSISGKTLSSRLML